MSEQTKTVQLAQSVSATDDGLVTAKMLVEYLNSQQVQPFASGTMDLDLASINLRCNGRSVLKADSNGLVSIGSPTSHIDMQGSTVYMKTDSDIAMFVGGQLYQSADHGISTRSISEISIYGTTVNVTGTWRANITAPVVDVNGQTNLVLHGGRQSSINADDDMMLVSGKCVYLYGPVGSMVMDYQGTNIQAGTTLRATGETIRINAHSEVAVQGNTARLDGHSIVTVKGDIASLQGSQVGVYSPTGYISASEYGMLIRDPKELYLLGPENSLVMDKQGLKMTHINGNILNAKPNKNITIGEVGFSGKTSVQGHEVELKAYSGVVSY